MKPIAHPDKTAVCTGKIEKRQFSAKVEDFTHLTRVLSDTLYTNKIGAVVREYATNAADAHMEAGKGDKPIHIVLPSHLSPSFIVRDFGKGLSEEEVYNIYCMYGSSTKRDSNSYTGQLGIGCKSGFAYTDSFMITSVHNGSKSTYTAYSDDGVFSISKMAEVEAKDEETGMTIAIPVAPQDIQKFKKEAIENLKFFTVTPKIEGAEAEDVLKSLDLFSKSNNPSPTMSKSADTLNSSGWVECDSFGDFIGDPDSGDKASFGYSYLGERMAGYTHLQQGNGWVVMGNIGYPLDLEQLTDLGEDKRRILQKSGKLLLYLPTGSVEISANREGLQYTKYTVKNLEAVLKLVLQDIFANTSKALKSCKSIWDAASLANSVRAIAGSSVLSYVPKECWIINGVDTSSGLISINSVLKHPLSFKTTVVYDSYCSSGNTFSKVYPQTHTVLVHNDEGMTMQDLRSRLILYRSQTYIPKLPGSIQDNRYIGVDVAVFTDPSESKLQDDLNVLGLDKSRIIKASDLPVCPVVVSKRVRKSTDKGRVATRVYQGGNYNYGTWGDWITKSRNATEDTYYVETYKDEVLFRDSGGVRKHHPASVIKTLLESVKHKDLFGTKNKPVVPTASCNSLVKGISNPPIHGIPTAKIHQAKDNWIKLDEFITGSLPSDTLEVLRQGVIDLDQYFQYPIINIPYLIDLLPYIKKKTSLFYKIVSKYAVLHQAIQDFRLRWDDCNTLNICDNLSYYIGDFRYMPNGNPGGIDQVLTYHNQPYNLRPLPDGVKPLVDVQTTSAKLEEVYPMVRAYRRFTKEESSDRRVLPSPGTDEGGMPRQDRLLLADYINLIDSTR